MKMVTGAIAIFAVLLLLDSGSVSSQQLGDKVYWMLTTEVPIGNLTEYHALNEQELIPLLEKHGYKHVATWQTIVGDIEEVVFVAEFENMTAYHTARRSMLGSEEWKIVSKKINTFSKSLKSRFLSAAPYSQLK